MLRKFSKVKPTNFKLINTQITLNKSLSIRKFSTENTEENKIENLELDKKELLKQRLKLIGIGFTGGCIGTVAGIGGGVIMVPLMAAFTTLTRHQMTAT